MTNTNATNFRNNLFDYLNQAVLYNDVINVNTKNGNAIILSEEEYSSMMETLYLMSHSKTSQEILEAMKENKNDCAVYDPAEKW
jgi:toxin-antitoxin system, antitoxin component, PHD family